MDDGVYEVEVGDNPSSSLWQIKGSNIYMKFRYIPYLYRWDEGILEVYYGSGVFYEKDWWKNLNESIRLNADLKNYNFSIEHQKDGSSKTYQY